MLMSQIGCSPQWPDAAIDHEMCYSVFKNVQRFSFSIVSITYHTTGVHKGCTGAYCGLEFVPRK